jgi:adenylate cyclase class 2
MREIELKVRLQDKPTLLAKLIEQGVKLSEPVTHHDVVYGEAGVPGDGDNNAAWLRVRTETAPGRAPRVLFRFKRSVSGQLDSIEHETEVADAGAMTAIIDELGFELYSDLTKTRQKAHVGAVEICVDEVPLLGSFLEVEKLCADDADHDVVVAELWGLLESLGIAKEQTVTDGYDVLMEKHKAAVAARTLL